MLASSRLQTLVLCSRLAEAERFYSDVLGLPLKGRSDGGLVYEVGGGTLRVFAIPDHQPSGHTAAGFAVPNLDAVLATLAARGVVVERLAHLPHDAQGVVVSPDCNRVVWIRDPDGNYLSVVQFK